MSLSIMRGSELKTCFFFVFVLFFFRLVEKSKPQQAAHIKPGATGQESCVQAMVGVCLEAD